MVNLIVFTFLLGIAILLSFTVLSFLLLLLLSLSFLLLNSQVFSLLGLETCLARLLDHINSLLQLLAELLLQIDDLVHIDTL